MYTDLVDISKCGRNEKWVVKSKEKKSEKVVEEMFDAVVVATGHYSQPRLPSIRGKSFVFSNGVFLGKKTLTMDTCFIS